MSDMKCQILSMVGIVRSKDNYFLSCFLCCISTRIFNKHDSFLFFDFMRVKAPVDVCDYQSSLFLLEELMHYMDACHLFVAHEFLHGGP